MQIAILILILIVSIVTSVNVVFILGAHILIKEVAKEVTILKKKKGET